MLILIVEDEPLVAAVLEWTLKQSGHEVLGPADSVSAAIALCGESRPDFALIDLNLREGGDGVNVAHYLGKRYRTPCIFMTPHLVHARAHRQLAWGVVRKPYDIGNVPGILSCVMALKDGREPAVLPADIEIFGRPHMERQVVDRLT
ncbi:MAG TPA: response regulator [Geminicoccus sp.]|jgi:DNA-binding response OmpR family regulator|uniref:response regulator n=1 Tax=Geminicoccus sp. TaxID=2024832 RepID=UPI002E362003|nr:response regulator [Geminicoccus sp.]HEX2527201.1 response regulator [Geminicoccus sp.]